MGFLQTSLFLGTAAAVSLYFYDRDTLLHLGNQTLEAVSDQAKAVSLDYYNELRTLYMDDQRHYLLFYAQAVALGLIVYIALFKRTYDPSKKGYGGRAPTPLSKVEQEMLLKEWNPQPLINIGIDTRPNELGAEHVLESRVAPEVRVQGVDEPVLNLAAYDFLGMSLEDSVRARCKECLEQYGCGSCGPRGFYGTSDQHLALETVIKDFFGTEEAIVYSDAASTMASIIPAFAKRGDVVIADVNVSESALAGIELSRSTFRFFKHNDVDDLANILAKMTADLKRKGKSLAKIRRYVVVEGLYRNSGDFAPLAQIISCAKRYQYRVILDDSFATGCVGATGRGSLERAGLKSTDVDFIAGSLATAAGSIGGFCTGTHPAVDHQRLAGAGYCFSASAPPFTCVAAIEAFQLMDTEPERLAAFKTNLEQAYTLASKLKGLRTISEPDSPLIFLELADEEAPKDRNDRFRIEQRLQRIVDACMQPASASGGNNKAGSGKRPVLIARSRQVYPPPKSKRPPLPNPSIRITISSAHSSEQIKAAFDTVAAATAAAFE